MTFDFLVLLVFGFQRVDDSKKGILKNIIKIVIVSNILYVPFFFFGFARSHKNVSSAQFILLLLLLLLFCLNTIDFFFTSFLHRCLYTTFIWFQFIIKNISSLNLCTPLFCNKFDALKSWFCSLDFLWFHKI